MKHRNILYIAALAFFLPSCQGTNTTVQPTNASESTSEVDISTLDYLRTEGTKIVDSQGNEFHMRGTNVGSLFVQESWMCLTDSPCLLNTLTVLNEKYGLDKTYELLDIYENQYWSDADFKRCQDIGFNTLRLNISYADMYQFDFATVYSEDVTASDINELELTYREEHMQKIDAFINKAKEYGLRIVLDVHGAWGSQNGNDHSIDSRQHDWLWRDDDLGEAFRYKTSEFWKELATRYKYYDNILGYDLLNEPAGDNSAGKDLTTTTGRKQWDFFDDLYQDIRAIDPYHIIIMESCWDAKDLPMPSMYNWENVVYQFHHYEWSGQDDDEYQYNSHETKVRNLVNYGFNVPIYMGEFNVFSSTSAYARVLRLYNENNIHWTSWAYRTRTLSNWCVTYYQMKTEESDGAQRVVIRNSERCDSYEDIKSKYSNQQQFVRENEGMISVFKIATSYHHN